MLPAHLPASPLPLLATWIGEAEAEATAQRARQEERAAAGAPPAAARPEALALCLSTADGEGRPSSRMVLARMQDLERGWFVVFTNRTSRKARELAARPWAAGVLHWQSLGRQVRVEGPVVTSPAAESDAYFARRPRGSRLGAWTSDQSAALADREALLARGAEVEARFADGDVPRPPTWGGYRLVFRTVELWVHRDDRLHDRAVWTRALPDDLGHAPPEDPPAGAGDPLAFLDQGSAWDVARLQP